MQNHFFPDLSVGFGQGDLVPQCGVGCGSLTRIYKRRVRTGDAWWRKGLHRGAACGSQARIFKRRARAGDAWWRKGLHRGAACGGQTRKNK